MIVIHHGKSPNSYRDDEGGVSRNLQPLLVSLNFILRQIISKFSLIKRRHDNNRYTQ